MLIEDTFSSAAKKANHCDVKVASMPGRGKKLRQTLREGSSTRQKVGSPQMKYCMVVVANPTETNVQLNHRGFWEITHDDQSGNLRRGDLVHEASNAWGNHTPDAMACPMLAQIVNSRGTIKADAGIVETTWARQWAKQSRRIQKILAYRRLAYRQRLATMH